jgi:hypothetical protein
MCPSAARRRPPGTAPFLPDRWWDLPLGRRRRLAVTLVVVILLVPLVAWWTLSSDGGDEVTAAADPVPSPADEPVPSPADEFVAGLAPARLATWDRLAQCESEGDWTADSGNGFFGGLQFTLESWAEVGGRGSPAAASRNEQIMRAEMLFERQGWGAWPNCSA